LLVVVAQNVKVFKNFNSFGGVKPPYNSIVVKFDSCFVGLDEELVGHSIVLQVR
jgi:hypothetical protein